MKLNTFLVFWLSPNVPTRRQSTRRWGREGPEELVEVEFESENSELLSEALLELGARSVDAFDADAGTPSEEPIFTDETTGLWPRAVVRAVVPKRVQESFVSQVADVFDVSPRSVSPVDTDKDWLRELERLRPPLTVGSLRILLPWHPKTEDGEDLLIEGGAAFGTGEHPTTRMCVEWVQAMDVAFPSVMDYGSGSGILALAALKAGASDSVGVDIDPDAVSAAQRNAIMNGFSSHDARFFLPPASLGGPVRSELLPDGVEPLPEDLENRHYDIVIANILLTPLVDLAEHISSFVHPGHGRLAISGLRFSQFDAVRDAYQDFFHDIRIANEEDGWLLVVCADRKVS